MLLLAGTIPDRDLPLLAGKAQLTERGITIDGRSVDIDRGTAAMISVVCHITLAMGLEAPYAVVAGDIGSREGSVKIYEFLAKNLPDLGPDAVTIHYIMPDIAWNKKVLASIDSMEHPPVLLADAGGMYVAKAGGDAHRYQLFTPDLGEAAFLADEKAAHPTYTRGFIFHMEEDVPELVKKAYRFKNAATTMFIKGKTDYVCRDGDIIERIDSPNIETLEPVGGTGDMVTGTISAMVQAGRDHVDACGIAGRVNRVAGELANPTPATQVSEIIGHIPAALEKVLNGRL